MSDTDVVEAVERLRHRLAPGLPIDRIVLFGSRARGDARPDSDVDLLVVSPAFEGKGVAMRAYPLRRAWDLDVAVDFLCYTPEEFEDMRKRTTIVRLALEEGREVLA